MITQDVADPEGICIDKIKCDGAAEMKGRFESLCMPFGIIIETNGPYIAQGNAIAERGFGTIVGAARSVLLRSPHLIFELWAAAVKATIYIKNRTPTDVLNGMVPLKVWQDKVLAILKHMHAWGLLAFKRIEAPFRPNKLDARAKKLHLVGYNTRNKTYRLWDLAEPFKVTYSAEVSFSKKKTRDVVKPRGGYDPCPEPRMIFQPGIGSCRNTRRAKKVNRSMNP